MIFGSSDPHPAADYLESVLTEEFYSEGEGFMLFHQDPFGERRLVVVLKDRDTPLNDDGPCIHPLIHEMDSAARNLYSILNRLPLRVQAGKCRE